MALPGVLLFDNAGLLDALLVNLRQARMLRLQVLY